MERPAFRSALRGYAAAEVDELVDRIERTLAGTAGSQAVTPDGVRSSVFSVVVRGYREDEVDAYLDQAVMELESSAIRLVPEAQAEPAGSVEPGEPAEPPVESWTVLLRERWELLQVAELPAGQRFERANVFGGGYDAAEIDAFVNRVRRILGSRRVSSTLEVELCAGGFADSRQGYDKGAVDAWLDRLDSYLHRAARMK